MKPQPAAFILIAVVLLIRTVPIHAQTLNPVPTRNSVHRQIIEVRGFGW